MLIFTREEATVSLGEEYRSEYHSEYRDEYRDEYRECARCGSSYVTHRCARCGAPLCSLHVVRVSERVLCPTCAASERRERHGAQPRLR
jgi:hypothetical protein